MDDRRRPTPQTFEEFWDVYVRAHSNATNRKLHFAGTSLAMGCVAGAFLLRRPSLLVLAPVVGYGFAWFGHFVFEKNKPASFDHPLWSFKADMLMWTKIAQGVMDDEVARVLSGESEQTVGRARPEAASAPRPASH
jgi:hypothetical protein